MLDFRNFALLTILILLLLSSTVSVLSLRESGSIGDVKYSLLPPDAFQQANGCGWQLLSGQVLSEESDLYILIQKTGDLRKILDDSDRLPDANGMFIRSTDMKPNDEVGDPDAQARFLKVGSPQEDAIRNITGQFIGSNPNQWGSGAIRHDRYQDGDHNSWGSGPGRGTIYTFDASTSPGVSVANENRPKNINLFTYLKIDDEKVCE